VTGFDVCLALHEAATDDTPLRELVQMRKKLRGENRAVKLVAFVLGAIGMAALLL
jgi:hypothetical protein